MTKPNDETLIGYLLGALDADDSREIERQLASDTELRNRLDRLEQQLGCMRADDDQDEPPPLLDHWGIALVEPAQAGASPPYLMFSSHPELLIATAKRLRARPGGGFAAREEVKRVRQAIKDLGGGGPAMDRVARTRIALRAKYELLRKGKLKDSDSLAAALYRRIFENEEDGQADPLNAEKLPPVQKIEQFFPDGGSYFETTADGWSITGFLLKH